MSRISLPLQVLCSNKETVGSCQVEFYTSKGALLQGTKMFVLTLCGAIFSVVLPGLHFITVPLGILASPFVGVYVYYTRKDALKWITGDFICPDCQATNHVAFRRHPCSGTCAQCQHTFQAAPLF